MATLNRHWIALAALLVATGGVYANHFGNGFHFDDSHTIQSNPHITSLANAGRFFVDATTFSALPLNQTYRPLLTLSLAFDFWCGGGLKPWVFHVSSFSLYLLQLVFMFLLFRRLLPKDRESTALFGTAIYALHPISAETVNYIIQRGDVMSTAAVVAGLWLYARNPRPFGWHLLPLGLGCLSKPPAVILAPLIFAYVYLFTGADETAAQQVRLNERRPRWVLRRVRKAARESAPAFALAILYYFVQKSLTLPMATPPGFQPRWYILTQPWVTLHYFRSFFWPNALTADSDWGQLHSYTAPEFIAGVVFLLVFVGFMIAAGRTREWRVEAFAMAWFILALLPTALTPLAEVMNDHRMYFPHVGTALLVAAVLGRARRRISQRRVATRRHRRLHDRLRQLGLRHLSAQRSVENGIFAVARRHHQEPAERPRPAELWADASGGRRRRGSARLLRASADHSARLYVRGELSRPRQGGAQTQRGGRVALPTRADAQPGARGTRLFRSFPACARAAGGGAAGA